MCNEELKFLLTPAVEETEEEKEEEKKATATFVSADPDDYDEDEYFENDEDEDENEDDNLMYIEEPEYHIIHEGLHTTNRYIQKITELLALPRGQQPLLSVYDFSELIQALQDLKHTTLPIRNLACDYQVI